MCEGLRHPATLRTLGDVAQRAEARRECADRINRRARDATVGGEYWKYARLLAEQAERSGDELPIDDSSARRADVHEGCVPAIDDIGARHRSLASLAEQMKVLWRGLQWVISDEIVAFTAVSSTDPVVPHGKRRRWLDLWCKGADMIAAFEAEYGRKIPYEAAWVARAAELLRAQLLDFHREVRAEYADMPEIEAIHYLSNFLCEAPDNLEMLPN